MGIAINNLSSFACEMKIIQGRNMTHDLNQPGNLFVRYYLSTGSRNTKVQLNTKQISSKSAEFVFNEFVSLDCQGTEDSIKKLKQESIVFELRWRNTVPVFGNLCKSKVLGRTEISWKDVFESKNMEMEKWVVIGSTKDEDVKPPMIEISVKIGAPRFVEDEKCGCKDREGCGCAYYDAFVLVAAVC